MEIKSTQDPMLAQPRGDANGIKSRKNRVVPCVAKKKGNKHPLDTFLFKGMYRVQGKVSYSKVNFYVQGVSSHLWRGEVHHVEYAD